jgi:hypothetical protein
MPAQPRASTSEREKIRDYWLGLPHDKRWKMVQLEKETVLRKMKEQQRHGCTCAVCGRKRNAIEEELEVLYDAYYDELEQYALQQRRYQSSGGAIPPPPGPGPFPGSVDLDRVQAAVDRAAPAPSSATGRQSLVKPTKDHKNVRPAAQPAASGHTHTASCPHHPHHHHHHPSSTNPNDRGKCPAPHPPDDAYESEESEEEYDDEDDEEYDEGARDVQRLGLPDLTSWTDEDYDDEDDLPPEPEVKPQAVAAARRPAAAAAQPVPAAKRAAPNPPTSDFFGFGGSLTVKAPGILTVADDLLKNDGQKFLEMMETLADKRIQREREVQDIINLEDEDDEGSYDGASRSPLLAPALSRPLQSLTRKGPKRMMCVRQVSSVADH